MWQNQLGSVQWFEAKVAENLFSVFVGREHGEVIALLTNNREYQRHALLAVRLQETPGMRVAEAFVAAIDMLN